MIKRDLEKQISNRFGTGKAILLIGSRQVSTDVKVVTNENFREFLSKNILMGKII